MRIARGFNVVLILGGSGWLVALKSGHGVFHEAPTEADALKTEAAAAVPETATAPSLGADG